MMRTKAYVNGKIVEQDKACISLLDRGLNYGDGLFETIKAVNGLPLFVSGHLERLKSGSSAIGLSAASLKPLMADIRSGVMERLLKSNGLSTGSAYIRVTVTRGIDAGGHLPAKRAQPTAIIRTRPLDEKTLRRREKKGVSAILIRGFVPAIPGVKTLNYLPNVIGRSEASRRKAYEGIFTDSRDHVSEGTSSNLFIVEKAILKTPPIKARGYYCVLPGITRGCVIELARANGIKARETIITAERLADCDEAFLTNSIAGIVPLVSIDGKALGSGRPGPATKALQELYNGLIRAEYERRRLFYQSRGSLIKRKNN
ncbi:MAG: aminotransferase class IV [Deltaproteobacteria bacterium]